MKTQDIVKKLWNLCNVLRDDGITYLQYVTELTYLLFLKMTKETGTEEQIPKGYRWDEVVKKDGNELLDFYRKLLVDLGGKGSGRVQAIYANASTSFRQPRNLRTVVEAIDALDWYSAKSEGLGDLYEGLLEKNAEETKSGAGQYFTPRPLIESMVALTKPQPGEHVQDPAVGTGGFLINADRYVKKATDDHHDLTPAQERFQRKEAFYGVELVADVQRLALMNAMLHDIDGDILLGDTLGPSGAKLPKADLILTNPPFGTKKGGGGPTRDDITYPTSNKQLVFLQHIYRGLKPGGRAAVVLPDNVLFEEGVGQRVRGDLMDKCDLHTILRLPTGIFYAQGVKTNVLFFTRGAKDKATTKAVWFFDMRTNMPSFGKRTPFTRAHFTEFEKAYGEDSLGKSKRKDLGETGRFRKFTREEIAKRGDNLDIAWLKDDSVAKDWAGWVLTAQSAGLDAVAVTDHNTPEGIADIQAAAMATALRVFPGVEVTVGGIHLLCMLDPKATRDDVISLLAKLGIDPPTFGTTTAAATKGIVEAIRIAADAGAVVVAAHVNGPRGLVMLETGDRKKALQERGLSAAELCAMPANPSDPTEWKDPASDSIQEWLDGTNTEGRRLVQVWSSDSHEAAQVGRQFTWLKMTRPDLEGLRLALLDGDGSVKPKATVGNPNRHANYAIESIKISKAKYIGRPEALTLRFNPWLNAIIGGRGTGKSTVVDLMRSALGRTDELAAGADASLRTAFERRMRVPVNRADEGLLTAETSVEILYRKDGERFAISWAHAGAAAITRLQGEVRIEEQGAVGERFPIRIYSQKQLFDLAREPNALFNVIDDSDDVRGADLARVRHEAETKYLSHRAEARALRAQSADLPARRATLADVRRKIEVLQAGESAQTLGAYRVARSRDVKWSTAQKAVSNCIEAVENAAENVSVVDVDVDVDLESDSDDGVEALRRVYGDLNAVTQAFQDAIASAIGAARMQLGVIRDGADALAWRAAVTSCEERYKRVIAELVAAGIPNPDEYAELLERATRLEMQLAKLEESSVAADARDAEAAAELARFRGARDDLTKRRSSFATKTSGELVRVEILAGETRDGLEPFLQSTLGIPRFDEDYRSLAESAASASEREWSFDRLDGLVARIRELISDGQKAWPAKDRRFESALRKVHPEKIDRMALYLPDDTVAVSFRDPRDPGETWKKLAQGSPGQQTAALLAFVLGYGDEPIVLDQPEDDLDNTLIYELVVRRLRETKPTRQVIVVTHNPNIVVHGDAELVVSLEARVGQTHVAFEGGLQEQKARDQICHVMEGGREAFESRYRRIMNPR